MYLHYLLFIILFSLCFIYKSFAFFHYQCPYDNMNNITLLNQTNIQLLVSQKTNKKVQSPQSLSIFPYNYNYYNYNNEDNIQEPYIIGKITSRIITSSQENEKWQPLRIHISVESLEKYVVDCENNNNNNNNCKTENELLTPAKKELLIQKILPEAIKLHTDRLLIHRVRNLVIMKFISEICYKYIEIPPGYESIGITNADFILFIISDPMIHHQFVSICSEFTINNNNNIKRPTSAILNIPSSEITFTSQFIRKIAHNLAHALGFDATRMATLGMLANISFNNNNNNNSSNIGNNIFVISSKVMEVAKYYFNSSDIIGVPLDHTLPSHWEQHTIKNELMSVSYSNNNKNLNNNDNNNNYKKEEAYYSLLTMAAFVDMGFYRVQWGMAENNNNNN